MSFNIVWDSCTYLTKEDFEKGCYTWIPLTLLIGDEEIVDDDTFDQHSLLEKVANSKGACKSACPSPETHMASPFKTFRYSIHYYISYHIFL